MVGLGANLPADALYPHTRLDSQGQPLHGSQRYRLHFAAGELPPVKAFWSVTAYGADDFLIANPLNRYALGDRDAPAALARVASGEYPLSALTFMKGGRFTLAGAEATGAVELPGFDERQPEAFWRAVRDQFSLARDFTYFNTGGLGPTSSGETT